jgi:hypothetical protein
MANFKIYKEVSALPSTLAPDAIYLVRVGTGFDFYCSDATGSVAHKLNPYPDQVSLPAGLRFDQAVNGTASSTYTLVNATMSYFPLALEEVLLRIDNVIVAVATANATGTFQVGLYDSNIDATPRNLIFYSNTLNTIATGAALFSTANFLVSPSVYQTRELSTYLLDCRTYRYWLGFLSLSAAGAVRSVAVGGLKSMGFALTTATSYATCRQRTGILAFPELNPFTVGSNTLVSTALPSIRLGTTSV